MSKISKTLLAAEAAAVSGLMGCQNAPVEHQQTDTTSEIVPSGQTTDSKNVVTIPLYRPENDPGHLQALMGVLDSIQKRCDQVLSRKKEDTLDLGGLKGIKLPIAHIRWEGAGLGNGTEPPFNPYKSLPVSKVYLMADGDRFDLDCTYGMNQQYGFDTLGTTKRLGQTFARVDTPNSVVKGDFKYDILEEKAFEIYSAENPNGATPTSRIIVVERIRFAPGVERNWVVSQNGDHCVSSYTLTYRQSFLLDDKEVKPTVEETVPVSCEDYVQLMNTAETKWGHAATQIESFWNNADKKPSNEGLCAGKKNCTYL